VRKSHRSTNVRGPEEADVDATGLEPVGEDLRHRHDGIGGLGQLAVADRQWQSGGLRPDATGFVDEHDFWRMQAPRQVGGRRWQPDADEAHRAVAQRPRRGHDHHVVGRVCGHPAPSQGYRAVSCAA
jgi:hypothetical protein